MTKAKLLEIFREGYSHGVRFGLIAGGNGNMPDPKRMTAGRDEIYYEAWVEGYRAARLDYLSYRKRLHRGD